MIFCRQRAYVTLLALPIFLDHQRWKVEARAMDYLREAGAETEAEEQRGDIE